MSMQPAVSRWLPSYDRSWLRRDGVAGLTVAAVLIPSALSYAAIVGVEPIVGLYTVPFALVAYAILGGSRLLVVGPDAAISVLAAATIADAATGDDQVEVMIALSILTGLIFLVFRTLRMGWIADLVPDPVLKGFIQGLVWVTILGQVPALLGVATDESFPDFWRSFVEIIEELDSSHGTTAVLGVACVVALVGLKRLLPRLPGSLIVLVGSMVVVGAASLGDEGVSVVGEPSGGAFGFDLPTGLAGSQWVDLLPGAIAIVVVGFTESMGAAKSAAQRTGERLDPNEELLALGASNLGAGISGGYVVTGTLSKTSVAMASGGRSQIGNLVAAAVAVLSVFLLRPLFEQLASTVLAALVIVAMAGMVDVAFFRRLWRISRIEFLLAVLTFLGVLTFGVLPGVVVGVVLALVILVDHIGRPAGAVLGVAPDGSWRDVEVVPDASLPDGMLVYRQEAPIVFVNARRVADRLRDLASDETKVLVVDMGAVSTIDSTGFEELRKVRDEFEERGIAVWVVNPSIKRRQLNEHEAEILQVTMPTWFEHHDEALEEYRGRVSESRVTRRRDD